MRSHPMADRESKQARTSKRPEPAVGRKHISIGPNGPRLEHLPDMSPEDRHQLFGTLSLTEDSPTTVVAGEPVELGVTYRAGHRGLRSGAQISLMWRLPADWGAPQFEHPEEPNFVSARTSNAGSVRMEFAHRGGVAPWNHIFTATLEGSDLEPGEAVHVRFGDRSAGCPGWQAQTSSLPDHQFLAAVRPNRNASWIRLADLPPIRVQGSAMASLVLTCPSTVDSNEPLLVTVRGIDAWGNPSRGSTAPPVIHGTDVHADAPEQREWDGEPHDVWSIRARLASPGVQRLRASVGAVATVGNPIDCGGPESTSRGALMWGDMHGGQGELGVGHGTLDRYFSYGRHIASLDFASHQANDVYVTKDDWDHTRDVTERHHEPNAFVPFLGCEWTALKHLGGDHNVFYLEDRPELRRASRWFADPDTWPDAPTPPDLYASLQGVEAMVNLHVGGFMSDLDFHDDRLERLIEIQSTHATSRWFVADALERGYRLAVVGSTDGVTGRPGACVPGRRQSRNLRNGATGLYAAERTREAIWSALKRGRCYATTGERIILWVECAGQPMGSHVAVDGPAHLDVSVVGTAAIERILLMRAGTVVSETRSAEPDVRHPRRYRLLWRGSRERGTARDQVLAWDGEIRASAGQLHPIETIDFYAHNDHVSQDSPDAISWRCSTAGNEAGIVFDIDADRDVELTIRTPHREFTCDPAQVEEGVQIDLPDLVDAGIRLERAPDPQAPSSVTRSMTDPSTSVGEHPYWVEVVQVDGARAWSSPIFVERRADHQAVGEGRQP